MSAHFQSRRPSAIRLAQIEFMKRTDNVGVVNTAIGNVSLPMHPAMQRRMHNLSKYKDFADGVVKYSPTVGLKETNETFLHVLKASGLSTEGLYSQITDGGSQAMELIILGVCGAAGSDKSPLLLIDPAYTNYKAMAQRLGRKIVSIGRKLDSAGNYSVPNLKEMEEAIKLHKPGAVVVIPYDNPTGQFFDRETMVAIAKITVKYNMWFISDEAYRELYYDDNKEGKEKFKITSSIWAIDDSDVPGIIGRRISIETSSKVWNGCGLRIGALITDSKDFHDRSVAENTANLCSNIIGQYIFAGLLEESVEDLQQWFCKQREYYRSMLVNFTSEMKKLLPEIIISSPDASIYSVIDVRELVDKNFDALDFVMYIAQKGVIDIEGAEGAVGAEVPGGNRKKMTLLVSPMGEFYNENKKDDKENKAKKISLKRMGRTQMRVAYVETPEKMQLVPKLFAELFAQYCSLT
ncbi:MAG: pyridoxal phosphate-dependent aminotransferase [Oligoflexia bacterium]|nr:pyridoxal phosphate-dependent aminotransferase [Oligoflexia bacterium]